MNYLQYKGLPEAHKIGARELQVGHVIQIEPEEEETQTIIAVVRSVSTKRGEINVVAEGPHTEDNPDGLTEVSFDPVSDRVLCFGLIASA